MDWWKQARLVMMATENRRVLKYLHCASCGDIGPRVEDCDDGNEVDTDDCRNDCTNAACGDGVVWAGVEECDDGNDVENDFCTAR